jgi:hypothetical protein
LNDGEQVFGELALGLLGGRLVEDAEAGSALGEDVLDELEPEPRQAVPVGHDNLRDASAHAAFHHLAEAFPAKVDAGADVADDSVVGEHFPEGRDLPLEVVLLVVGGDAAVDEGWAAAGRSSRRVRLVGLGLLGGTPVGEPALVLEKGLDVVEAVGGGRADAFDFSAVGPGAEGGIADAERLPGSPGWDEGGCLSLCMHGRGEKNFWGLVI